MPRLEVNLQDLVFDPRGWIAPTAGFKLVCQ